MAERKSSQARIDANKKYASKNYKRYAINTRLEYVPQIEEYKQTHGFSSDSGFFNAAVQYVIKNNIDINSSDDKNKS